MLDPPLRLQVRADASADVSVHFKSNFSFFSLFICYRRQTSDNKPESDKVFKCKSIRLPIITSGIYNFTALLKKKVFDAIGGESEKLQRFALVQSKFY